MDILVPTRDLWAAFPQDYISLLSQWYCSLGQCCESGDCRITNNITGKIKSYWGNIYINACSTSYVIFVQCSFWCFVSGLASDLQLKLHGQHLAQSVVLKAVQGFISNPESNKPLTLSFHGCSGTGKNFVTRIVADNLYRDGVKSECVRLFIAPFHFPHARLVDTYKVSLAVGTDMTLLCQEHVQNRTMLWIWVNRLYNKYFESLFYCHVLSTFME